MDAVTLIRIVAGFLFLFVLLIGIFYLVTLSNTLAKCSATNRTMQPGMVWLLLIPLFNIVWHFIVVSALTKSIAAEVRARSIPVFEPNPGQSVGIAMCVCGACSVIPFVNFITIIPHLVLWIVYWQKIAGYARTLDATSVNVVTQSTYTV
jgi:hypothetical protein